MSDPRVGRSEETMAACLSTFGWTCGPEFWRRYYNDPWVFNLANAVETLAERVDALAAADEAVRTRPDSLAEAAQMVLDASESSSFLDRTLVHALSKLRAALAGSAQGESAPSLPTGGFGFGVGAQGESARPELKSCPECGGGWSCIPGSDPPAYVADHALECSAWLR